MKILKYSAVLMTFIVFAFIGCSDKDETPVNPNTVQSLEKTSGFGAWIIEYTGAHAYAFLDEDSGFLLTLGIKNPTEFCSGTLNYDLFNFKDILLPNSDPDLRRLIRQMTGDDISAYVWHFESLPDNLITFVCSHQPVASGNVKFISTDNDYYLDLDQVNRCSFGSKANGTLTGPDGRSYKLNLVYQALVDKNDPSTLFKEVLTIALTPIGKK